MRGKFSDNYRIKDVRISFSDGTYIDGTLLDGYEVASSIEFPSPVKTTFIKITIQSVYYNSSDTKQDACISEIYPY